jgi:hypothetical protein
MTIVEAFLPNAYSYNADRYGGGTRRVMSQNLGRPEPDWHYGARPSKVGERVTRLELATSSLARRCSTTELHPRFTYEERPP